MTVQNGVGFSQAHLQIWISLLYRRVQKMEQIKPDHCDRYQNNRTKKMQLNGISLMNLNRLEL